MREKIIIAFFLLFVGLSIDSWVEGKALLFPQAGPDSPVTIAVLHPSIGTIKAMRTLREKGLLALPRLHVIGVYHEKQLTDYSKAREYVRENHLDWFSLFPVSGALSEETLFRRNPCTPEFEALFQRIDGLIFFGGPDIPPYLYKNKTSLLTEIVDPYRHFLELSFLFHLLGGYQDESFSPLLENRPDFPVLGICLGSQSLNVATGGTLTQDIWSEVYGKRSLEDIIAQGEGTWHLNPFFRLAPHLGYSSYILHPIRLNADGKFCVEMGCRPEDKPLVISEHHQHVERLGKDLRVIAYSLDGKVAEAIEHHRFPHVLGVQFHPEYPDLYTPENLVRFRPEDKDGQSLPSLLAKDPGSADFHKELWAWVSRTWLKSYTQRAPKTGTMPQIAGRNS